MPSACRPSASRASCASKRLSALLTTDPAADWAAAAVTCGYFDQAHLAREVRELADITPTELRAEIVNSVQDGGAHPA